MKPINSVQDSVFGSFGAPPGVTLASLRTEHLFAADAATAEALNRDGGAIDERPKRGRASVGVRARSVRRAVGKPGADARR